MKKIVFLGLIAIAMIISNPCFAQPEFNQINPEGLFSLNSTLWQIDDSDIIIGFDNGTVYACISSTICAPADDAFYFDFIFISLFKVDIPDYSIYGILSPLFDSNQVIVNDVINNEKGKFPIRKIQDPWIPD